MRAPLPSLDACQRQLAAALLKAMACCSCQQQSRGYWIQGLTLPPGATVVNYEARKTNSGTEFLNVSFDAPGGWKAVKTHFDSVLKPLGFEQGQADASANLSYANLKTNAGVHVRNNAPLMAVPELKGQLTGRGQYEMIISRP